MDGISGDSKVRWSDLNEKADEEEFVLCDVVSEVKADEADEAVQLSQAPIDEENCRPIVLEMQWKEQKQLGPTFAKHCIELGNQHHFNRVFTPLLLVPVLGPTVPLVASAVLAVHKWNNIKKEAFKRTLKPFTEKHINKSLIALEHEGKIPTTFEQAKSNYKKLMKKQHPDKAEDKKDDEEAKKLVRAWEKLNIYQQDGFELAPVVSFRTNAEEGSSNPSSSQSPEGEGPVKEVITLDDEVD